MSWRPARSSGSCRTSFLLEVILSWTARNARASPHYLRPRCQSHGGLGPCRSVTGEAVGGGVILLQGEDDLGGTVKASIKAADGDPTKIVAYTKAEPLYLDDPDDLAMIRRVAKEIDARLLVVNPFSEFFRRAEGRKSHPKGISPASQAGGGSPVGRDPGPPFYQVGTTTLSTVVLVAWRSSTPPGQHWWSATILRPTIPIGTSWPSTAATCHGLGKFLFHTALPRREMPSSSTGWAKTAGFLAWATAGMGKTLILTAGARPT